MKWWIIFFFVHGMEAHPVGEFWRCHAIAGGVITGRVKSVPKTFVRASHEGELISAGCVLENNLRQMHGVRDGKIVLMDAGIGP